MATCLVLVVLVAAAFKLAFALRIPAFVAKDSQAYFLPAFDLVHGGQFELGLRRTPGYPLFLAARPGAASATTCVAAYCSSIRSASRRPA